MGLHDTTVHMDVGISWALVEAWRMFDHMSGVVDPKSIVDPSPSRTNRDV